MLETYDQISCVDKTLANFKLELHSLLDGINKEIRQTFTAEVKHEHLSMETNDPKKDAKHKDDKKKESRKSKTPDARRNMITFLFKTRSHVLI